MSTYPHFTLQSADVYKFTINTLDTLPLKMPGAIASRDLLRVLVFAAASRLSVHQACDQLEHAPSGPTVLGTLASQVAALVVAIRRAPAAAADATRLEALGRRVLDAVEEYER